MFGKQQGCGRDGTVIENQDCIVPSNIIEERNEDMETIENKWERLQAGGILGIKLGQENFLSVFTYFSLSPKLSLNPF